MFLCARALLWVRLKITEVMQNSENARTSIIKEIVQYGTSLSELKGDKLIEL